MTPEWNFAVEGPEFRARESQVEKFFIEKEKAEALVREGIQNSLDATTKDQTNVRIKLGKVSPAEIQPFTAGLFPHLDAVRQRFEHVPTASEEVHYLVFEDFNTKGLTGDPEQWRAADGKNNAFFNFFRAEGVSSKQENARGRHGVGKMVFTVASRAHCIFGVTATEDEQSPGPYLMGTSTLELHKIGSEGYHPDGWFGCQRVIPVRVRCCTGVPWFARPA